MFDLNNIPYMNCNCLNIFFNIYFFHRKPSPVRAPDEQPMFTFYIYAVLDKRFTFDRQNDTLWLLTGIERSELQITHFL